jgi:hypothetical protein
LWAAYFHEHPKEADADMGEDVDFDETLREIGIDSPDQWEEA